MTTYEPRVKTVSRGPVVDSGTTEHDPRLYETAVTAQAVEGIEAITGEHLDVYRQEGYLAVEGVFSQEEVATAKAAPLDLILGKVPDFQSIIFEAKAADRLKTLSDEERLAVFGSEGKDVEC